MIKTLLQLRGPPVISDLHACDLCKRSERLETYNLPNYSLGEE